MTRWFIRPLRRLVQIASILLLLSLPVLSLYTHYKEARAIADLPADSWRSKAVRTVDRFVGENKQRRELVDRTQGTFWSARIAGVSLTDPLAGAEMLASSRTFYLPMLASLLIPLVVTLLLGRVFCGWVCPMNTLLELVDMGRKLLNFAEIRPADVKFSLKNKYVMLAAALLFAALVGMPFLAMIYPPALISRELHFYVYSASIGIGVYVIIAICAIELLISRRWWCRYVCPGGALYSLLGSLRLVRIRRDNNKCVECGDCVKACQFGLKPMLVETTNMECTNCASCIVSCDSDALRYSLVLPVLSSRGSKMKTDSTNIEEPDNNENDDSTGGSPNGKSNVVGKATVGALLMCLLLPTAVYAHHILGLPHYSYKKNYPQVPTLEYPATSGPYDILMTSYPGKPVPGQAAIIAFYIKDRNTGLPYGKPVTVRALETSTFGANKVIHEAATHEPFDNQHKYTIEFPKDREYIVELTMEVEGQPEVIPFLIVSGEPTATASVIVAVVGGLLVFLIVVRAIKVKRDRRKKKQTAVATNPAPQASHA